MWSIPIVVLCLSHFVMCIFVILYALIFMWSCVHVVVKCAIYVLICTHHYVIFTVTMSCVSLIRYVHNWCNVYRASSHVQSWCIMCAVFMYYVYRSLCDVYQTLYIVFSWFRYVHTSLCVAFQSFYHVHFIICMVIIEYIVMYTKHYLLCIHHLDICTDKHHILNYAHTNWKFESEQGRMIGKHHITKSRIDNV